MVVAIVRSTLENLQESMRELVRLVGYVPSQREFFIKPNLPDSGPPGQGLYTDPRIVDAFLGLFADRGAIIGEGCIVGRAASTAFSRCGYGEVAAHRGARLIDLDRADRFEAVWPHGKLRLPVYVRSHEYVNIAKMKTHIQTGVTLGMKNQKGLLSPADKRRFHRLGLNQCIGLLAQIVQPALTIVDAIVALEGNGPWRFGQRVEMNLLVGGTDLVEVDNVCRDLMGFSPEHAPHIPPLPTVTTAGVSVEEARRHFVFDYQGHFVYKNVYEHVNDSCSGCNWTLYHAFKTVKRSAWRSLKFQYRGIWRRLDVVMGHAGEMPKQCGKVICLGDCAREFAEKHQLPIARGCPPDVSEVLRLL